MKIEYNIDMDMVNCSGLCKSYRGGGGLFSRGTRAGAALDGVEFSIARGEAVAVVGRNGAGKSTLLKILSTVVVPDSGAALVGGHDVVREPKKARAMIGCSGGDERSFYWRLTGRQNLELFASLQDIAPANIGDTVDSALAIAGISGKADVRFNAYSSGMRQRLSLARAMLHGPELLLLDEPNRGLDPIHADRFNAFLKNTIIGAMKKTVLFTTHDLEEAVSLSGRVALLERGRLLYFGPADDGAALRKMMLEAAGGEDTPV